jgi:hypothetical protein
VRRAGKGGERIQVASISARYDRCPGPSRPPAAQSCRCPSDGAGAQESRGQDSDKFPGARLCGRWIDK